MSYSHFPCRHLSQSMTLLGNYPLNNRRRGLMLKGEPLGRYDHSIIDIPEEKVIENTFLSCFYFYLTKHVFGISLNHCWSLRSLIDWYMTWCQEKTLIIIHLNIYMCYFQSFVIDHHLNLLMGTCGNYWRDQHYELLLIDQPFLEVSLY
jgi:hypothetical protein